MNSLHCCMQQQQLTPLSYYFSRFIAKQAEVEEDGLLAKTAAWLSQCNQQGDVYLDLAAKAETPWFDLAEGEQAPALNVWRASLLDNVCVSTDIELAPMVLDGNRLYLYRFHQYEQCVAAAILTRLQSQSQLDETLLISGLRRLFPSPATNTIDWQCVAAALAVSRNFAVISGGPGTGKTTSLVKVLTLLLEQQENMKIRLAAPTGKAAARMMESIRNARTDIDCSESIRKLIPTDASTIHRLLGFNGRKFRHHGDNPLIVDCLVIDEASMIDLPLMAQIMDALPSTARLILLGDRDQLASVEAGSVLGDITGHGHSICYSAQTAEQIAQLIAQPSSLLPQAAEAPEISNAIALLRTSHRFDANSGIGQFAKLSNEGNVSSALQLLTDKKFNDLQWVPTNSIKQTVEHISSEYAAYLLCNDVHEAMSTFESFRVLCAVKQGATGVEGINQAIANQLVSQGKLVGTGLVHGMPVMVSANHLELKLFNGDIGLIWGNSRGELRVYFRQDDNSLRDLPLQSLPKHQPAWAMTVHKSQGSEFNQVLLILPDDKHNPLLTRELLYTATTRARKKFILHAQSNVIQQAITHKLQRATGLAERLGW